MNPPLFRPELFWDVDVSKMDYEKSAKFIIGRVFDFGDVEDIKSATQYYGIHQLKTTAMKHVFASPKHLNFWSTILDIPLSQLSCTRKPSPPLPALFSMS
ncbi:MAG: hypothetical protein UY09_C0052G0009 [Parcubacteria group bacterium GW2011_GWA2_47_8]|nr:MAG: hypothetical protein UY09_C0052G0009 [Parcubacteria group bacterium GW2011_GWA2_47_8]OHB20294.1 MAG: hypothetical protein A2666_01990 [Parcubacteria group bacterium RIFCSPHIGHO2_01_FULL_47_10b]